MNNTAKSDFQALVTGITASLERIDTVYPPMIESAKAFDKELARKIEGAMRADRELLEYVKSKAEAKQLPMGVIIGLLGR